MAIPPNKSGYRTYDSRKRLSAFQLVRPMPVMDRASTKTRENIRAFAEDYCKFSSQVRSASDVTDHCRDSLERTGFDFKNGIYITESEGRAFAAIKYGRKPVEDGIRIIFSHNDSPGFGLKTNPVIIECDSDTQLARVGVELDLRDVGAVQNAQWPGHSYIIRGHCISGNGKRKNIEFPVYMPDINLHTDNRILEGETLAESYKTDKLHLVTGYSGLEKFLKAIGLKSESDFNSSKLRVYPEYPTKIFGEGFISGYAHDARAGTFSTLRAFEKTKSPYTTVLIGFDREEIGSRGPGGADSPFLDKIIDNILLKSGSVKNTKEITESFKREIFEKSLAINSDVNVCASNRDYDETRIDIKNIPKMVFGPFLTTEDGNFTGEQANATEIHQLKEILRKANIPFNPVGSAMTQDNSQIEGFQVYLSKRGLPAFSFGTPVIGTHSIEELIHEGDLYYTFKGDQAFLKADWKA